MRARGFTLVEVLVALGIVAIALLAGSQASNALVRNSARQTDITLAHVCAENALVAVRLSRQMPSLGDSSGPCVQAGRDYLVQLQVTPTPNPQFRRVDAQVFQAKNPVLRLSTIVGRY
ncbi:MULTISPECIES: type II secretion system minor pseudopilin GspI [Comamonas]|uniref:Type II secretion system protein I n=1 Tax=Comamonas flocculans TaxID=2597701 RepID=A0A5B8RW65_9BURK|nr:MULTISPECIES: type II secretion system minor pseudopilin GspI [Comamonas]QEA13373.1 type II secretion system protein GspI [Comamonas flocculans]QXL83442.1 type II secretion system minor pseudopilin GspI [Comamonas sp. NLF-1-9]